MASAPKSRWADTEEDAAVDARRKREKEEKKRMKAEKKAGQEASLRQKQPPSDQTTQGPAEHTEHAAKRQKLSTQEQGPRDQALHDDDATPLLRYNAPQWSPCRKVTNFETLNHIEEGSYGWVSRAKEKATGDIVALKKLKMESSDVAGFPITGLREIQCLMQARHDHIVRLREIVVGEALGEVFLVMDFLEHDLKTLQEEMQEPFLPSEIKTLMMQLTSAVEFLHDHWILHRDLKTSNILMNNRGSIKIADFGMARYFSDPPPVMTQLVVTLWYRAPELLLGAEQYSRPVDIWSIGCIFGELLTKEPLMQGKNEVDQLAKIFALCGIPNEETWPGFKRLPNAKTLRLPTRPKQNSGTMLRAKFPSLTNAGSSMLSDLLSLNPAGRPSASEILSHSYFSEDPRPKSTAMFPTFPSKAGQEKRRRYASPSAPKRGDAPNIGGAAADFSGIFSGRDEEEPGAGFQLKLV